MTLRKHRNDKHIKTAEYYKSKHEYLACLRKKKFIETDAEVMSHHLNQTYYKCGYCEHFHLTKRRDYGNFRSN